MRDCNICNSNRVEKLLNWKTYSINRCHNCQLVFVDPLPSDQELMKFYQGFQYNKPKDEEIEGQTKKRKEELKRLFDLSGPGTTNKKFLDYGGGTGMVFNAAQQLGLDTYFQDLDREAIAFVQAKLGLKAERIIEDIETTTTTFDYILSDNVIEHVKYPIEFTRQLYDKLNEDGTLIIKTPHGGNTETFFIPLISIKYLLEARKYNSWKTAISAYFKRFWHCDPPRHLFSFTKKSFTEIARVLQVPEGNFEIGYYSIPLFQYSLTRAFFSKDKNLKGLLSVLVRILILPLLPLEWLLKLLQFVLLKLGIISAGGIILKIKKGSSSTARV